MEAQASSDEDEVEKDVAHLAKNFCKFLKFKRDENGKFLKFKKDFKKKDSKDSSPTEMVTCFECKGHGHVKKECLTYLKAKGKVFTTTLSDSDGSNSDLEESCDREGNYFAFMAIAPVGSSVDLSLLMEELGEHIEVESKGFGEESDDEDEGTKEFQESYNSLLEKTKEYARVAKAAIRKMKKAEQDYKSLLVRYKERSVKLRR